MYLNDDAAAKRAKRGNFNKEFLLKSCKETGVMLTITPAPISICAKKEPIFISCPLRILVLMVQTAFGWLVTTSLWASKKSTRIISITIKNGDDFLKLKKLKLKS